MDDQVGDAQGREDDDHQREVHHENVEKVVVASTDTGAEPDAMMVKLHHTVVADVAVGAASRPEDVARLTELEFEK